MAYTTIDDPEAYFQAQLYTGTGSTLSVTLDGDTDMQPDFVWVKNRDEAEGHKLFDSVRGATKFIMTNNNDAEATGADDLTSFDSDGFTVGVDADMNTSGEAVVAWCWKESATSGFDIVSYTGNGSNRTISHSLSAVPKFIAVKNRTTARGWINGHASIGWEKNLYFDMTNAQNDSADMWNDTDPTSSVFTVGTSVGVNENTDSIIAYLWTDIQGFSKFGSYTGNGNVDGTFIYLGFRPAYIMFKETSNANSWIIMDTKRDPENIMAATLYADDQVAESDTDRGDAVSNGFKCRGTSNAFNGSGRTYIYAAFAEAPFVNSNGVPCNAR